MSRIIRKVLIVLSLKNVKRRRVHPVFGNAVENLNGDMDLELEEEHPNLTRTAVIDPFVSAPKKLIFSSSMVFPSLATPLATLTLIFICFGLDLLIPGMVQKFNAFDLAGQLWMPEIDLEDKKIFTAIMLGTGVMLGTVLSIIGMILELATSRFTTANVSRIFFRDKVVLGVIVFVVFSNVVSFFLFASHGHPNSYAPRFGPVLSMLMMIAQLVGLLPFVNYLFIFLDPQLVISKINNIGLQGVKDAFQDPDGNNVGEHQRKAVESIEHLRDAAHRCVRKRDKDIASKAIDGLCSFAITYSKYKPQMFKHWHFIPTWMRASSDFLNVPDEILNDLIAKETWVEWKIFRQYFEIYNSSINQLEELCYHIARNTRIIGQVGGGERGDMNTLDLSIKFFNTYLRSGMNNNSAHAVYIVLFQYKSLSEFCIEYAALLRKYHDPEKDKLAAALEMRIVQIAKFMRYYSYEALLKKLAFIVEVISHDIRSLCELAYQLNSNMHDELLDIFLSIYDQGESDNLLRGVRRAKICLATAYMAAGATQYARKIHEDFGDETKDKIVPLIKELQMLTNREWWEVSERGINMEWITDEQRTQLPIFFSWFKSSKDEPRRYLTPAERKKIDEEHQKQISHSPANTRQKLHHVD